MRFVSYCTSNIVQTQFNTDTIPGTHSNARVLARRHLSNCFSSTVEIIVRDILDIVIVWHQA